jgi:transmembrane sensor
MPGIDDPMDGAIRAQAAAWLARLRSEERTAEDEAGFRAWLSESAAHRQAFDSINAAWEAAGALRPERQRPGGARRGERIDARRRMLVTAGVGALAVVGGLGVWRTAFAGVYSTAVGEQLRVTLDDGSQIILDTDTKLRVAYGAQRRAVALARGRAHFDVTRDVGRPFIVTAGDHQVVADGKTFDVTREQGSVAVVAIDGQVVVRAAAAQPAVTVTAGRRVIYSGAPLREDRPDLAHVTAWQTGRAVFDNEPVASAVAEMNRYSRRPIVIADDAVGRMRVSGVYNTGDTEAFARSLAALLPLEVSAQGDRVMLAATAS